VAVVFYISGHGFGHAARQIEIINALLARAPELPVIIRTGAEPRLFARTLIGPAVFQAVDVDTGAIQRGGLDVDVPATIDAAAAFHRDIDRRADVEAQALHAAGARAVVGDIPPLAFVAAARAGVPSFGVSNFTWDWIYDGYGDDLARAPWLVPRLRACYADATEAWRMPLWGGFESFRTIRDLPFVARHARHARDDVRAALRLPAREPLVLVSFGSYGAGGIDLPAAARSLASRGAGGETVARVMIVSNDPPVSADVVHVSEATLDAARLRYEDLVAACDIVCSKPGYGIISECVANGARLLYTSRGRFREYDVFVRDMDRYLPAAFIEQDALKAGRWRDAVRGLLRQPAPPRPPTNGADVAVDWLLARLADIGD